jgi:TRAP-type uncharacterized transport system substrate-binding protein
MKLKILIRLWLAVLLCSCGLMGCDYFAPQQKFTLAIPSHDFTYNNAAGHLQEVLGRQGFKLSIIHVGSVQKAVAMVANGEADLSLVMNHSVFLADSAGKNVAALRTIMPLFRRFLFFYVPPDNSESFLSTKTSFKNKVIGVEYQTGETQINLQRTLTMAQTEENYRFSSDTTYDVYHFWGTAYSTKHRELIERGWKRLSLEDAWIRFIDVNNPYLQPVSIPPIPTLETTLEIKTLYSETILIGSNKLGETAVMDLTRYIYENKVHLLNCDRMFSTMDERYDTRDLLFPVHTGANLYLKRDSPTFLERYSDALAFLATVLASIYAGIQAMRNSISKRKKEQVDQYFIEFLAIKEDLEMDKATRLEKYDKLLHKLIQKMTEEKLQMSDFHILAILIQTELTHHKLDPLTLSEKSTS